MEKVTISLSEYIAMTPGQQTTTVNEIVAGKEGLQPSYTEAVEETNSLHFYFE
jgi:hypothetical protein